MTIPQQGPATLKKYNDMQDLAADLAPYLGGAQRGKVWRPQSLVSAVDVTLGNVTTAQSPFAAANDVITVEAATLYRFEFLWFLTHGATTHTTSFGLTLAGATLSTILGVGEGYSSAADTLATWQAKPIIQAAATVLTATSTAVQTMLRGYGHFRTTLGGTISPFVQLSADPTGTILSKAGSFFDLLKLGTGTDVVIGANAA